MRNLPASFWTPGPIGTKSPGGLHSRENSLDNSGPFSPGPVASPGPQPPSHHHIRSVRDSGLSCVYLDISNLVVMSERKGVPVPMK